MSKSEESLVKEYVKKPIRVKALRWSGNNFDDISKFIAGRVPFWLDGDMSSTKLVIETAEGNMSAEIGDYIIKEPFDTARAFYPCKPDIFAETYTIPQGESVKAMNTTGTETLKQNVPDVQVFGNPDTWMLLSKASSKSQGWMKSTKAMNLPSGILVQTCSETRNKGISEGLIFIPDLKVVKAEKEGDPARVMRTDDELLNRLIDKFEEKLRETQKEIDSLTKEFTESKKE